MKKHDENKDLKLLSKIAKIDERMKTISISKSQVIGNKRWGRLDYLTHYCGYVLIWNSGNVYNSNIDNKETIVKEKREEHKLTNKNNRTFKNK